MNSSFQGPWLMKKIVPAHTQRPVPAPMIFILVFSILACQSVFASILCPCSHFCAQISSPLHRIQCTSWQFMVKKVHPFSIITSPTHFSNTLHSSRHSSLWGHQWSQKEKVHSTAAQVQACCHLESLTRVLQHHFNHQRL
jgi:hypothetical protein